MVHCLLRSLSILYFTVSEDHFHCEGASELNMAEVIVLYTAVQRVMPIYELHKFIFLTEF